MIAPGARSPGRPDAYRGILWMLFATLAFNAVNTLGKFLVVTYPVAQVVWAQYVVYAVVLALVFRGRLPVMMASQRPGLQIVRGAMLVMCFALFFTALRFLPLADATAIMFTHPIFVTALAGPLLGERIGWRRWAGVAAGFAGALIIIRPGGALVETIAFLPLVVAFLNSLYQIVTRRLSRTDDATTTLVYTSVVGTLITSAAVPWFWNPPDLEGWLLMAATGLASGAGQFALIKAFVSAPATTVAPFAYPGLIWAAVFGLVVFGDWPDGWTGLGAVVITASGLYIFRQERRGGG